MAKKTEHMDNLRQKDLKALQSELADLRVKLQKARIDVAFGRLPKNSEIGQMRRQVARIQTILNEKEAAHA